MESPFQLLGNRPRFFLLSTRCMDLGVASPTLGDWRNTQGIGSSRCFFFSSFSFITEGHRGKWKRSCEFFFAFLFPYVHFHLRQTAALWQGTE